MTFEEFKDTLVLEDPPAGLGAPFLSLWKDARGDWEAAHRVVQSDESSEAAWVHAYLHRKDGDLANVSYWYLRAHRSMPSSSSEEEWERIVRALLSLPTPSPFTLKELK